MSLDKSYTLTPTSSLQLKRTISTRRVWNKEETASGRCLPESFYFFIRDFRNSTTKFAHFFAIPNELRSTYRRNAIATLQHGRSSSHSLQWQQMKDFNDNFVLLVEKKGSENKRETWINRELVKLLTVDYRNRPYDIIAIIVSGRN